MKTKVKPSKVEVKAAHQYAMRDENVIGKKMDFKTEVQLAVSYLEDGAVNTALRVLKNALAQA